MFPGRVVVGQAHRLLYADTAIPATLIALNPTLLSAHAPNHVVEPSV
jgi:hypothetical protein